MTVTYADVTTSRVTAGFSGWPLNTPAGKPPVDTTTAVATVRRDAGDDGRGDVRADACATKVPLDAFEPAASITLPVAGSTGTGHLPAYRFGQEDASRRPRCRGRRASAGRSRGASPEAGPCRAFRERPRTGGAAR